MKILVIGAHPDDIELSVGGIVAKHVAMGYEVELCDLTAGEMGSNGTPEQRLAEGQEAAKILGAGRRHNLGLPDGLLIPDRHAILKMAELVRAVAPDLVLAPWWQDRHPDHEAASLIATRGCHLAGLHKFPVSGERHRPERMLYYFLGRIGEPSFIVNVDDFWDTKMAAIKAHASQFASREDGANPTFLNRGQFFENYELRFRTWGRGIGARYGEALVSREPIAVQDITYV
ncbi:MAG: bacillithiol biosynthesis deacetylase BshB1 [Firmicutes bacterium]|nr:bacillithiol biosynthesis deacetylase BshB1 [Bacillota bacterium]